MPSIHNITAFQICIIFGGHRFVHGCGLNVYILFISLLFTMCVVSRSRTQVGGEPSLLQKVPEKYFVVKNDEFVRVKYVFIFEMQKPV